MKDKDSFTGALDVVLKAFLVAVALWVIGSTIWRYL
jgi:hypothetical protein